MHSRTKELLDYLDHQRAALRAAFEAVPAPLRDRAPAPGRWSTAQCVEHLSIVGGRIAEALTTKVADAKARGLAAETATDPILPHTDHEKVLDRSTKFSAPDPIQPTGVSADAAWAAIERSGTAMRDAVSAADGLALGSVSWPHPRFGSLTAYQWIAFSGAHEGRHAAQIREIAETLAAAR